MRDSNYKSIPLNKAAVSITSNLYDRRALDCTSDQPLVNSLNHLTFLTSSSAKVRETLANDGGLERLISILHECRKPFDVKNFNKTTKRTISEEKENALISWKWTLAFQCIVLIGTRGSEQIRKRAVDAGLIPIIATVLDNYLLIVRNFDNSTNSVLNETFLSLVSKKLQQLNANNGLDKSSDYDDYDFKHLLDHKSELYQYLNSDDGNNTGYHGEKEDDDEEDKKSIKNRDIDLLQDNLDINELTIQQNLHEINETITAPRFFLNGILIPKEDDVIWSLQLLAFISKYSNLKDNLQFSNLSDLLSLRSILKNLDELILKNQPKIFSPSLPAPSSSSQQFNNSCTKINNHVHGIHFYPPKSEDYFDLENDIDLISTFSATQSTTTAASSQQLEPSTQANILPNQSNSDEITIKSFINGLNPSQTNVSHARSDDHKTSKNDTDNNFNDSNNYNNNSTTIAEDNTDGSSSATRTTTNITSSLNSSSSSINSISDNEPSSYCNYSPLTYPHSLSSNFRNNPSDKSSHTNSVFLENQSKLKKHCMLSKSLIKTINKFESICSHLKCKSSLDSHDYKDEKLQCLIELSIKLNNHYDKVSINSKLSSIAKVKELKAQYLKKWNYETYFQNGYESEDFDKSTLITHPLNIFPLVEKFTIKDSNTSDMFYWAGVIMRNSCRKDEQRGGVRQCGSFSCGKWEKRPKEFAKCKRCKRTKYCSKTCQLNSWVYHRNWCIDSGHSGSSSSTAPSTASNNPTLSLSTTATNAANTTTTTTTTLAPAVTTTTTTTNTTFPIGTGITRTTINTDPNTETTVDSGIMSPDQELDAERNTRLNEML